MTSIELKDRLAKAEEKVTKCENTIERRMRGYWICITELRRLQERSQIVVTLDGAVNA